MYEQKVSYTPLIHYLGHFDLGPITYNHLN